ncbi:uncharacterized protein LOC122574022 isoform X6 [Bombus pyrosoma]|uniref:uncharacterized protein LOC122574022 isoform X6 n=1 Tax=Bombus pyrosoma TaxID=396416 RepID=UPI001CB90062|nr:uncharacterized protein LOC122574022 isoform X6 [Bombus pyrosoma]
MQRGFHSDVLCIVNSSTLCNRKIRKICAFRWRSISILKLGILSEEYFLITVHFYRSIPKHQISPACYGSTKTKRGR